MDKKLGSAEREHGESVDELSKERNMMCERKASGCSAQQRILIVLMLFVLAAVSAFGVSFSDSQIEAIAQEGSAAVQSIMEKKHATAVTVVLGDANGIIWQGAYGEIEQGKGALPTEDTLFGICSVSKTFTAAAVMKLVDKGMVSLDEPVVTYIPDFKMEDPRYRDITVRMLLNHSSGLPGQSILGGMTQGSPYPTYAERVVRAQASQYLKFEPGTNAVYTNDGFSILEVLVKRVSGMSFVDFVQREIFDVLGMNSSRFLVSQLPKGSFAVPNPADDFPADSYLNMYGTGGVFSSVADMAKFAASFLTPGRLLSAESIRKMGEDQTKDMFYPIGREDAFRYGLGWDSYSQPGMAAVGIDAWQKGGDLGFYGATLVVLPKEGLTATVLGASNFSSSDAGAIAERVLLKALVEEGRLKAMPKPWPLYAAKAALPDFRERAMIAGYYAGMPYSLTRAVFDDEGRLTIEAKQGESWVPSFALLEKRVDGWYSNENLPVSVKFVPHEGKVFYVIRFPSGYEHYVTSAPLAQKLDSGPALPEAWKTRCDTKWLLSSDLVDAEDTSVAASPTISPQELQEVPGYLTAEAMDGPQILKPIDATTAAMWLSIPVAFSRDLKDLRAETIQGASYLRFGAELYRDSRTVPTIEAGTANIPLVQDTYGAQVGQWLRLPVSGTAKISGAALWRLYDQNFNSITSSRSDSDGEVTWSGTAADAEAESTEQKQQDFKKPEDVAENHGGTGAWLVVYASSDSGATVTLRQKASTENVSLGKAPQKLSGLVPVATFGEGSSYRSETGGYTVLSLKGSWHEMGRQYGALAAAELQAFYAAIEEDLVARGLSEEHRDAIEATYQTYTPEMKQLMNGMAETSGLSLAEHKLLDASFYLLPDFVIEAAQARAACSGISVSSPRTADGKLYFARNWDMTQGAMRPYLRYMALVAFNPTQSENAAESDADGATGPSLAFANVRPIGQVYVETGINERGVFVELNNGSASDPNTNPEARFSVASLFEFLRTSETFDQMVQNIVNTPMDASYIIQVASAERAVSVEKPTFDARVIEQHDGALYALNNFARPTYEPWKGKIVELPDNAYDDRQVCLDKMFASQEWQRGVNLAMVKAMMDKTIQQGGPAVEGDLFGTVLQVIVIPEDMKLLFRGYGYSDWAEVDLR
ncbi:MAG TPA: C45 family autoproteolytic acyltransferase/hydrolase, partial [Spirochaetales bacterium]|nr:C45 family autoproteolytic acyltransferase/hydrolase [Spirochaetales bacterium]